MGANFVDDESGDHLRSSVGPMQLPVSLHKLLGHRPGLYLSESAPNFNTLVFKTGRIMVYQCPTVRPSVRFTCCALT